MKKGIIFNAEMINAILQGQKTQTRRVVKYASENDFRHMDYDLEKGVMKFYTKVSGAWTLVRSVKCPFGKVGDKLWVKETWTEYDDGLVYRASYPQLDGVTKWQSPAIMPKEYSRITLAITNIRVERLQDISEEDAKAEGAQLCNCGVGPDGEPTKGFRSGFVRLWRSIYKDDSTKSWFKNPYVWVIDFEVTKC